MSIAKLFTYTCDVCGRVEALTKEYFTDSQLPTGWFHAWYEPEDEILGAEVCSAACLTRFGEEAPARLVVERERRRKQEAERTKAREPVA